MDQNRPVLLMSSLGIFRDVLHGQKLLNIGCVQLGKNTLAVYLLHGFVVMLIARLLATGFSYFFVEIGICIGFICIDLLDVTTAIFLMFLLRKIILMV